MGILQTKNYDEILNGLIRIGEVCEVDYTTGTARVVFDDDDSIVSGKLQVVQRNTFENKDFAMPDIGEDVVCIFLSSGMEEGFIIGSVYADEVVPPETTGDRRTVVFADDTRVSYDRVAHELNVVIGGTQITANASSTKIKSASITLDGEVTVTGNVTAQKSVYVGDTVTAATDCVGGGISLKGHVHTGNMGSPTSAPLP